MQLALPSPFPPPLSTNPIMGQRWSDATFIHWRVDPAAVEKYMPEGCVPDIIDGSAWVGLIAFQMSKSTFFDSPRIPWLGDFPEINVRIYSVDSKGQPGVVFLSLEASRLIPVLMARLVFGLRYMWASMHIRKSSNRIEYRSRRHLKRSARSLIISEHSLATEVTAKSDPVAIELTARWAFHQRHLGSTLYCRNTHEPWPLHSAALIHLDDQLLKIAGFGELASNPPDSVLYSPGVDTKFAAPTRL